MHFLFLWFLIPLLVHARLHEKDCQNICKQAANEERQCSLFITKYKGFIQFCERESLIHILNDAMGCCNRAISHYDTILNDIGQQSKKHRHEDWCKKMKKDCEKNKNELTSVLNNLETELNSTLSHVAFKKAEAIHKESESKADLANIKNQSCPPRRLNNIDEVVAVLIEVAHLYEDAAVKEREALAILIAAPSAKEENKVVLTQAIDNFQALANKYKKEASDWAISVVTQKTILKEKVATLREDIKLFIEKGLKRSGYELQKQAVPILEQLIESSSGEEGESFEEEIALLKGAISAFEKESDSCRLTDSTPVLSPEEFKVREKDRKALFFKSDFLLAPDLFFSENLENSFFPRVVPLDGQKGKKKGDFVLYTEQFYRFLIQSESAIPELFIQVLENGQVIHVEKISLPFENPQGWETYLKSGMFFIPETKLKSDFGLDLRLSFACNPANKFSMLIAQKSTETRYQFSVSLTPETSLYECSFSEPPPWQLASLRKPALATPNPPMDLSPLPCKSVTFDDDEHDTYLIEPHCFPVLDKLVEALKSDPLALASYVQNEIAFVDPYLHQENGVFYASGIHRNPCMTYLEQQGTPWELCQLLVYLLRKAGCPAVYATGAPFSLPKNFVERLLLTKLPEETSEGLLQYPWVVFFDGKEWISLFPWMKEIQIQEGHDLYNYMPEDYASANRWILRYLKGDEKILKHIGPDGDDTAGILFVRFVEEELRKQGLSLNDIGIHRTQVKRQFSSWQDFPHPSIPDQAQIFTTLNEDSHLFAKIKIQVCSHQNPDKSLFCAIPLIRLSCGPSSIHFSSHDKKHQLHLQIAGESILPYMELDESDQWVDIKIDYGVVLGRQIFGLAQTFHVAKGTTTALCSHFGGASPKMTTQFYEQFSAEKDEKKRLPALLSFVGSSYFEKCSRVEKILARLHKVNPAITFAFGLSKLSPDLSKGAFQGNEDLVLPQVDMFWFQAGLPTITHPSVWHQEFYTARMQCESLFTIDASSNEHQILREVFKDPYAVSTVKLLQLAHQQQQKNGLEGEGFLSFTATSFEAADEIPEAAQSLYFSHLKDLNLREVKASCPGQWNVLKQQLDPNDSLSAWSYAYMTPGPIFSQDNSYKEMGTLIISPNAQYALISSNNLIFHGGLGSPLPPSYFTPYAIKEWQLVPTVGGHNSYTLNLPPQFTPSSTYTSPAVIQSLPGTTTWRDDVRAIYKATVNYVGDPVDIVTGAFYLDETDLSLPGPFSLTIRRNYNSQNPLIGEMGCGWKLSLNPRLVDQDGKRFAAELDGTVIVYSYNRQTGRWEVFPEDNPELSNFNQQGIGSFATPFHSYIENDLLYGADGSKRFYENGLLQKWVDVRGATLSFFYQDDRLVRIESSNGDFCGFHYNHAGNIGEIYAKDGRHISYHYDSQGDLVKVLLPNTAEIRYEYDRHHRIIRETKPHGKVLENIYDDRGRVREQRSPMGLQQEMISTAIFEYGEGITTVTDANEKKTNYKIFEKQIYKITDPLGFSILQAWFIDEKSWFDPETEKVTEWDQKGGAIRSLKVTTDKRGLTTSYLYDNRGNPEIITLEGEDLTGSGESKVSKKLVHNERNLCVEEEIQGQRTLTTYDPTFPYLPKRIEKYSGNILISYVDWEYNSLGQLEKEDHSGSITLWKYNPRGFPSQKIQVTGTGDPDVITTYAYSHQGQCTKVTSADGVQENRYDLMGNQTESKVFSLSGELLSATHIGYDLNNMPIWRQAANPQNTIYFDYHASGLVKAKRQSLTPNHLIAYTLYEYDARGDLIEEVDPLGNTIYRDYDALGRVKSETRENLSTLFTYEPGGLLEAIVSPSGAKTNRLYTTNGLIKEELYPDGTKSTIFYDCLSRPIRETKNGITWEITYDDPYHRVTRTNMTTRDSEIEEFDARGNLIRFTDAAGHTSEKTYDHLNRIKTETSPSGEQIVWSYQGDTLICTLPNGEKRTQRYKGGCVVESKVVNAQGHLLATNSYRYDPETDIQKVVQGEEITTTWMNSLGLPIKVQKGSLITTYEYDFCGHCIASTDGDGRTTHQTFDGLGRIAQKELPDGGLIEYIYDLDSNLAECHLPNGNVWKASYDSMKRKTQEALQAGAQSSFQWGIHL